MPMINQHKSVSPLSRSRKFSLIMLASLAMLVSAMLLSLPGSTANAQTSQSPETLQSPCQNEAYLNNYLSGNVPWYCNNIDQQTAAVWSKWLPIAVIALMASFSIATLILIMGLVFRSEKLRNFGIAEFYESTATAIIVILFLSITGTLFGTLPSIIVGPYNPYETVLYSMNAEMLNVSSTINTYISEIQVPAEAAGTKTSLTGCVAEVCTGLNITSALASAILNIYGAIVVTPLETVLPLLVDGLLALSMQFYMILFFMQAALPIFLIPGIIFRAFLPTRSVGGMLIAIAIGTYLIMPIMYAIAFSFTSQGVISNMGSALNLADQPSASLTSTVYNLASGLQTIQSGMGTFWLGILFYPALILALTYSMIREIAGFIGGSAHVSGKLKMIAS